MNISPESHAHWLETRKNPQFGAPGNEFNLQHLRQMMEGRQEPADPNVQCRRTQIDTIPAEWVMAPGADPNVRLLYLHGGGYLAGSGENYIPFAAVLSAAAQCAVLLIDYRLAPEHPFPAGLEDCVHAHGWMRENGPHGPAPANVTFIAGDSAGGGLTLATLLALRDRHLPLPAAGLPLSAFTDLTLSGESLRTRADTELYMHPGCLGEFVQLYIGSGDIRDPLASPVFGDYTGIPPLLIQVGDYELILDDSIRTADKARADGVAVQLEIWPGQCHVFQIRELPESRQAIARMAAFLQAVRSDLGQAKPQARPSTTPAT